MNRNSSAKFGDGTTTNSSAVVHVAAVPLISLPFWSLSVAVSWDVSPSAENAIAVSDKTILAAAWVTATAATPLADPAVAVMVAVPLATAVTSPEDDTVATDADDELHDTLAPLIVAPFWSLTVAESWEVSPSDEKLKLVNDSVIDVATGVGGLVGVVPPSPHAVK